MSNRISIYLVILYVSYGLSQSTDASVTPANNGDTLNITGRWFAVMGTDFSDSGKCCNLFKNNRQPECLCITAYFIPICDETWEVYLSAYNNKTNGVRVSIGGCSSSDNKVFGCVEVAQAEMDLAVISTSKSLLSEKVVASGIFNKYQLEVIGYSGTLNFMITTIKFQDNTSMTSIFTRTRFPEKKTIWRGIVLELKKLGINSHDLAFYKQDGCTYPSHCQCNEIMVCTS